MRQGTVNTQVYEQVLEVSWLADAGEVCSKGAEAVVQQSAQVLRAPHEFAIVQPVHFLQILSDFSRQVDL